MTTIPPVPPIPDLDRYAIYSLNADTASIDVNFPIFGTAEDLTVTMNGSALLPSNWALVSKSGNALSQLPLPITDGQVQFSPVVPSGSTVEIIGSWSPRALTMPSSPGITRREYNQSYATVVAGMRELRRQIGITASPVNMSFNAFGTLANRVNYNSAPAGFVYLQTDDASGRPIFYVKNSAASGDWSQALIVQSPNATGITPLPVGAIVDFAGYTPPGGFAFCAGQSYSRTTYAGLLTAITATVTGTTASGSPNLTGLTVPSGMSTATEAYGYGVNIEGPGIPAGTFVSSILSGNSLAMSANATSSASVSITFFPHGNGDGLTTFNVPDYRGRLSAGRDNMGGSTASRITNAGSTIVGTQLGGHGGQEYVQLTPDQNGTHTHIVNVTDPGHVHALLPGANAAAYAAPGAGAVVSAAALVNTGSSTTGVTAVATNSGSGNPHTNMPPTYISNKIIRIQ